MCKRAISGTVCHGRSVGDLAPAPSQKSFNYDNVTGRRLNPAGGHYMIPPNEFAAVVAQAQYDPRILNCYRFVPLPPPAPPCLPASMLQRRR